MFKRIFLIGTILLLPLMGYAQVVPPPVPPPPPPGLPINGLVEMLFLIGMVYGSKKITKDSSS